MSEMDRQKLTDREREKAREVKQVIDFENGNQTKKSKQQLL